MFAESEKVSTPKKARIDIRTTSRAKRILEEAAALSHKGLTEFLLDQGLKKAEQVLADQRVFLLDEKQWQIFQDVLEGPAQEKPRLKKLLATKSVFEK